MNAWWNQQTEPQGYNPYDNPGMPTRELIEAMERAWKACLAAPCSGPLLTYPSSQFWDSYYNWLASPDRGHEFEPYGSS